MQQALIVEYIFIVEFSQQHQSTFQQDLADAWTFITTILIANLKTSNNFQRRVMPNRIHQLIVKLTPNTDSVRLLAQENILNAKGAILISEGARRVSLFQRFVSFTIYSKSFELIDVYVPNKNKICNPSQLAANAKLNETPMSQRIILFYFNGGSPRLIVEYISSSNSEGARAPSSKLIVRCGYTEISFHFCKDSKIFREGVKDSTISIIGNNCLVGSIKHLKLSELIVKCPIGLIVRIIGLRVDQISIISLIGVGDLSLNSLVGSSASLARQPIGNIGLGVSFIGGFIGFVGLGFFSLDGLIDHNDLVGCIVLVNHIGLYFIGHNGLVSFIGLGIVGFKASASTASTGLLATSASLAVASLASSNQQPHRIIGPSASSASLASASLPHQPQRPLWHFG